MASGVAASERVLQTVEECRDELVELARDLVRIPTVNPPGEHYPECAQLIGERLSEYDFEVDYPRPHLQPVPSRPRVNVVGVRRGEAAHPLVHLNGHFDVVPAGEGWTLDPFAAEVRDGRLYGRGAADMKGGLASAILAAEALRRAGVRLQGTIEVSGTVDEESGGTAGVAELAKSGRIAAGRTDHVIIPEPLNVDRVCIGHRGVYWFKVKIRGRSGHGSMPFLGSSAIDPVGQLLERVRSELRPALAARRTAMPVVPEAARRATINVNSILGGQAGLEPQTPCVADYCEVVFDRRYLLEENLEEVRTEVEELLRSVAAANEDWRLELEELLVVRPTETPREDRLVRTLETTVREVLGRSSALVASPGTYDHKHVTQIGGVTSCVAYGPGVLEQAHQPDEWCRLQDMVDAAKIMALTLLRLLGTASGP